MNILGMVGSYRRLGNTEILVKEALSGAREAGASVNILRISDFRIDPCKGCVACMLKKTDCRIQDDFAALIKQMDQADGIVLGAPSYFFTIPAQVKALVDRLISYYLAPWRRMDVRMAVSIAVATADLGDVTPRLNSLLNYAGFEVVGVMKKGQVPGPGEVLLDEACLQETRQLGKTLVRAVGGAAVEASMPENTCPICWSDAFHLDHNGKARCAICLNKGTWSVEGSKITIAFPNRPVAANAVEISCRRLDFGAEMFGKASPGIDSPGKGADSLARRKGYLHSGDVFKARRQRVASLAQRYRDAAINLEWLRPTTGDEGQPGGGEDCNAPAKS